jgi:hypothetical protein
MRRALAVGALTVTAVLTTATLPAVASAARGDATAASAVVAGEVAAGGDVAGAKVTFRDTDGDRLRTTAPVRTLRGGAFAATVKDLPAAFRVEAHGGKVDGRRLAATLVADVERFDPATHPLVSVNPGTTLVARYRDEHPKASLERANSVVARFLGLASGTNLDLVTSESHDKFDHDEFLAAAQRRGGVDRFLDRLVRKVDRRERRPFTAEAAPREAAPTVAAAPGIDPEDLAKFIFESLRQQANDPECLKSPPAPRCKDQPLGDLLRFFSSPTELALADIINKLDQVMQQLALLQDTANTIVGRLDQATYDITVGFMNPDAIGRAMKTMKEVAQSCVPNSNESFCVTELGDSTAEKPGALRNQIRGLIDSGVVDGVWKRVSGRTLGQTTTGILDVLPSVIMLDSNRKPTNFFTNDKSKAMLATLEYFYDIEMSAITLATNYWRWQSRAEADVKKDIDVFDTQVAAQKKVFSPLPDGTLIDVRTGLMWAAKIFCGTYAAYGPTETGKCPRTYAGFPITDQRLVVPQYPNLPYFTQCVQGQWCMGLTSGIQNLLQGATTPWSQWLKTQAGVTFTGKGPLNTWLVDVTGKTYSPGPHWRVQRNFVGWDAGEIDWTWTDDDPNGAYYFFVRRPTEAKRYR